MLPIIPNQAKWMKALDNKDINNLSPLVVSRPRIPLRGLPPGTFFSHKTIAIKHKAIKELLNYKSTSNKQYLYKLSTIVTSHKITKKISMENE